MIDEYSSDRKHRRTSLFWVTIGILTTLMTVVEPVAAQDGTYNKPRYRDTRLDWCQTWGTDCGRPAALAFCNRRRYAEVGVFRAERVGKSEPTRLIGSNQVCSGQDFCTAFAYIKCTNPIPSERVFVNPVWKNRRLDVCLRWAADCGKPAADAFCRTQGYLDAFHAEPDAEPGHSSTRVISSDQICDGSSCRGFQQIICR
ncbi:hypothetical protein [Phormidesmis priestleyi]